jgi:hypothetical protein
LIVLILWIFIDTIGQLIVNGNLRYGFLHYRLITSHYKWFFAMLKYKKEFINLKNESRKIYYICNFEKYDVFGEFFFVNKIILFLQDNICEIYASNDIRLTNYKKIRSGYDKFWNLNSLISNTNLLSSAKLLDKDLINLKNEIKHIELTIKSDKDFQNWKDTVNFIEFFKPNVLETSINFIKTY